MTVTSSVLKLMANGREITVERYLPPGGGPAPGVLYLHEIFGLLDCYREDARELASRGYVVWLPDLFSGRAIDYCVRAAVRSVGRINSASSPLYREIDALLDQLKQDDACNGRLGIIGMCLTGGFVIQAAMRDDMEAPVVYHHSFGQQGAGLPLKEEDGLATVKRMQGHWSRVDPFCPKKRRERLKDLLGDRLDAHVYNIPHGFRSAGRGTRDGKTAWERTLAFFDRHLTDDAHEH